MLSLSWHHEFLIEGRSDRNEKRVRCKNDTNKSISIEISKRQRASSAITFISGFRLFCPIIIHNTRSIYARSTLYFVFISVIYSSLRMSTQKSLTCHTQSNRFGVLKSQHELLQRLPRTLFQHHCIYVWTKGGKGENTRGRKKKIEVSSSALSKNTNTVKRKADHNQKGLTDQLSFDLHTTTHRTTRTGRKDEGEVLMVRGVGIIKLLPRRTPSSKLLD